MLCALKYCFIYAIILSGKLKKELVYIILNKLNGCYWVSLVNDVY